MSGVALFYVQYIETHGRLPFGSREDDSELGICAKKSSKRVDMVLMNAYIHMDIDDRCKKNAKRLI